MPRRPTNKKPDATTPPNAAPTSAGIATPAKPTLQTITEPKPAPEANATEAFGCREITLPDLRGTAPASTAACIPATTPSSSPASRRHRNHSMHLRRETPSISSSSRDDGAAGGRAALFSTGFGLNEFTWDQLTQSSTLSGRPPPSVAAKTTFALAGLTASATVSPPNKLSSSVTGPCARPVGARPAPLPMTAPALLEEGDPGRSSRFHDPSDPDRCQNEKRLSNNRTRHGAEVHQIGSLDEATEWTSGRRVDEESGERISQDHPTAQDEWQCRKACQNVFDSSRSSGDT